MLQTGGNLQMDIYECRALFNGLIDSLGEKYTLSHIKVGSFIVNNPHFENGIVKLQGGYECDLSTRENEAVKTFLIATNETIQRPNVAIEPPGTTTTAATFAKKLLQIIDRDFLCINVLGIAHVHLMYVKDFLVWPNY